MHPGDRQARPFTVDERVESDSMVDSTVGNSLMKTPQLFFVRYSCRNSYIAPIGVDHGTRVHPGPGAVLNATKAATSRGPPRGSEAAQSTQRRRGRISCRELPPPPSPLPPPPVLTTLVLLHTATAAIAAAPPPALNPPPMASEAGLQQLRLQTEQEAAAFLQIDQSNEHGRARRESGGSHPGDQYRGGGYFNFGASEEGEECWE